MRSTVCLAPGREISDASRRSRTQEALCAALLSLLEEQPFERITVRDIAARASVSYATFFRRYPDKDALLHDVAGQEIRQLLAMTLPILSSVDSRALTKALCGYVWVHRKLWSALLTGGASATLKEAFVAQARELAVNTLDRRSRLPGDLSVVFAVASTIEVLSWWLSQAKPVSPPRMSKILDRLVVTPSLATWERRPS